MSSLEKIKDVLISRSAKEKTVRELLDEQQATTEAVTKLHDTIKDDIEYNKRKELDRLEESKRKSLTPNIISQQDNKLEALEKEKEDKNFNLLELLGLKNILGGLTGLLRPLALGAAGLGAAGAALALATKSFGNEDGTPSTDAGKVLKDKAPKVATKTANPRTDLKAPAPEVMTQSPGKPPNINIETTEGKAPTYRDPTSGQIIAKEKAISQLDKAGFKPDGTPKVDLNVTTPSAEIKTKSISESIKPEKFNSRLDQKGKTPGIGKKLLGGLDKTVTVGALGALNPVETAAELTAAKLSQVKPKLISTPAKAASGVFRVLGSTAGLAAQLVLAPSTAGDGTISGMGVNLYNNFVNAMTAGDERKANDIRREIIQFEKDFKITLPEIGLPDVSKLLPAQVDKITAILRNQEILSRISDRTNIKREEKLMSQGFNVHPSVEKLSKQVSMETYNKIQENSIAVKERRYRKTMQGGDEILFNQPVMPTPQINMPPIVNASTVDNKRISNNNTTLQSNGMPRITDEHMPF